MNLKKRNIFTALYFSFLAMPLAAQNANIMPAGMTSLMDSILEIFTGGFVKTILIIMLAATAVAYGFNKDNEKMKRNCIAIGIAIAIIIGSTVIVDAIWVAAEG